MQFKKYYLLFSGIFFLFQNVHGHTPKPSGSNQPYKQEGEIFKAVEHLDKYVGCSGNIRAGYIESSIGSDKTLSANAIGGKLGCGYTFNENIKVHLGLYTSLDTGLNRSDDNNIQDDFFNNKKDGYILLGEAYLNFNIDKFEFHLGRQKLDTPHFDADDLRMIPNLFEAYIFDYHASDNLYFGSGFVREMSGWENGADRADFIGVGDAFGGNGGSAWVSWINYEYYQLSTSLWYYLIPDHLHIVFAEIIYEDHITDQIAYTFGLQYDWGHNAGANRLDAIHANTWGVFASLSGFDLTASFAYNQNYGGQGAISSLGGGPFFTSMEELTLDAVSGDDASAFMLLVEYSPLDYLTVGGAFGKFKASDRSQFDVDEINVFVNVNWDKKVALEVMYANLDDKNTLESDHQFRAILTYKY